MRKVGLLGDDKERFEFSETHKSEFDYHKLAIKVCGADATRTPFVIAVETEGRPDVNERSYAPGAA